MPDTDNSVPSYVFMCVWSTLLTICKVGGREDSSIYIRMKIRGANEVGIKVNHVQLSNEVVK